MEENCGLCSEKIESSDMSKSRELVMSLGFDDSQRDAILQCIALRECNHRKSVKLIWGPPGTGKTKTIASLLFSLLKMKCRTLTCAPTNVAILGVAKRLRSCLNGTLEFDTYGLGDVVLLGNGKRMNIVDHEDVHDVFLDYRIIALMYCFAPMSGWRGSVDEMIRLLEDPETPYLRYLEQFKHKDVDSGSVDDNDNDKDGDDLVENGSFKGKSKKDFLRKLVSENAEKNKKKKVNSQERRKSKCDGDDLVENGSFKGKSKKDFLRKLVSENAEKNKKKKVNSQERRKSKCDDDDEGSKRANNDEEIVPWTFEEFFAKNFSRICEKIVVCTELLYTHMPTSCLPLNEVRNMIRALDKLQTLENFLGGNEWSKEALMGKGCENFLSGKVWSKEALMGKVVENFLGGKVWSKGVLDMLQTLENFLGGNMCSKGALMEKGCDLYRIRIECLEVLK